MYSIQCILLACILVCILYKLVYMLNTLFAKAILIAIDVLLRRYIKIYHIMNFFIIRNVHI